MVTCAGFCCGEVSLPLRDGAYLERTSRSPCLSSTRVMQTACVVGLPGTWVPGVHATCDHNEIVALLKRSLGPTPYAAICDRQPVLAAFSKLRRVARRFGAPSWGYLETAQAYKGSMRRRYLEAHRSLMEDGPVCARDCRLKAFVKAEKFEGWKLLKPRMIFPRSPRYNLALASRLKPFEHWFWGNLKSRVVSGVGNSRVVAKGLNQVERANLIVRKMSDVGEAVVFEVDGAAFEAHVDVWQLVEEHAVYGAAFPGDGDLMKLLNAQLSNRGVTTSGIKFGREGGRASGDVNTGMGNTLVMLAVVMSVMSHFRVKWDVLVDGDNALLFLEPGPAARVHAEFAAIALRVSGHEMVLERPVTCIEEVRFGRSAPVKCTRGWKMVCDWRRVVSHRASSHQHLREPLYAREFLHGVGLCESVLSDGVPVLWAYANHLRDSTVLSRTPRLHGLGDYEMMGVDLSWLGARAREPDWEARQSFFRAFGVEPEEQLVWEESIRASPVDFSPGVVSHVDLLYGFPFE